MLTFGHVYLDFTFLNEINFTLPALNKGRKWVSICHCRIWALFRIIKGIWQSRTWNEQGPKIRRAISSISLAHLEQFWCLSQSKSFLMWIKIWTSIFNHSSQSAGHMLVEDCYHSFWPLWIANMLPSRQGGLKEQSIGSTGSMIGKVL